MLIQYLIPIELGYRDDTETHIRAALEVCWSRSGGDWDSMLSAMNSELSAAAQDTVNWMTASVNAANKLSEPKIKKMIQDFDTPNSIPKLNKKKVQGRLYSIIIDHLLLILILNVFRSMLCICR